MKKKITLLSILLIFCISLTGCALWDNEVNEMMGTIEGHHYNCMFYSNTGDLFMTMSGDKIDLRENIVRESTYNGDSGWGYTETKSSIISVIIDGKMMANCGSTMIFAQDDLTPDVDFTVEEIDSHSDGSLTDWTSIAAVVNRYKNAFGQPLVVLIQSQLGDPICAYSADKAYWEVCQDLPKTTKIMIDGKALYIHRANFQIIPKNLLNE